VNQEESEHMRVTERRRKLIPQVNKVMRSLCERAVGDLNEEDSQHE